MSVAVRVLYFASLRERAGHAEEHWRSDALDLAGLYDELDARHAFGWPRTQLRVAVDGAFAAWSAPLRADSEVVFIPPVSGG